MFGGVFLGLLLVSGVALAILVVIKAEPLPEGQAGPEADLLTERIEQAVGLAAWQKSAAVAFTFASNRHFWDRRRKLVEVRWRESGDDLTVQYDSVTGRHVTLRNENPLPAGSKSREFYLAAHKKHTNDAFWLNPFSMMRAPGSQRRFIGDRALLVTYSSGGVTPGDSYLYITDRNYRPIAIKMWVSIIPLKGLRFSVDGWQSFGDGAWLGLKHHSEFFDIDLKDVVLHPSYPNAEQPDRFKPLLARIGRTH